MPRLPILFIAVLAASASGAAALSTGQATSAPARPTAATATAPLAPAAKVEALVVRTHGGAEVLSVQPGADGVLTLAFTTGGSKTTLVGKMSDPAKRKYRSGDVVLFETKWDEDGFKLRSASGALMYKVKIKDDKIKVSDNEENANPFELKTREGNRIKVVGPGESALGDVRGAIVEDASGKKLFDATGRAGSAAYAVLLLEKIPLAQRYVILAELFTRGK